MASTVAHTSPLA